MTAGLIGLGVTYLLIGLVLAYLWYLSGRVDPLFRPAIRAVVAISVVILLVQTALWLAAER